jgi:hypothetical protein
MTKKNAQKRAARAIKDAHGGSYQHHLRSVGGADGAKLAPVSPTPLSGELTPLTFTCLLCKTGRDLPLRDFGSGTIFCPNHDPPRQFNIPNNTRYRRLAHEIDALRANRVDVELGLIALNTEPYLVLHRAPRVEVSHVDTFATRLLIGGSWAGPGSPLVWEKPLNGNIGASVLLWLERNVKGAA